MKPQLPLEINIRVNYLPKLIMMRHCIAVDTGLGGSRDPCSIHLIRSITSVLHDNRFGGILTKLLRSGSVVVRCHGRTTAARR